MKRTLPLVAFLLLAPGGPPAHAQDEPTPVVSYAHYVTDPAALGWAPRKQSIDSIVLHSLGTLGVQESLQEWKKPVTARTNTPHARGMHYVVDGAGTIYQSVSTSYVVSHAWYYDGRSIGIAIERWTSTSIDALSRLVRWLAYRLRYSLPLDCPTARATYVSSPSGGRTFVPLDRPGVFAHSQIDPRSSDPSDWLASTSTIRTTIASRIGLPPRIRPVSPGASTAVALPVPSAEDSTVLPRVDLPSDGSVPFSWAASWFADGRIGSARQIDEYDLLLERMDSTGVWRAWAPRSFPAATPGATTSLSGGRYRWKVQARNPVGTGLPSTAHRVFDAIPAQLPWSPNLVHRLRDASSGATATTSSTDAYPHFHFLHGWSDDVYRFRFVIQARPQWSLANWDEVEFYNGTYRTVFAEEFPAHETSKMSKDLLAYSYSRWLDFAGADPGRPTRFSGRPSAFLFRVQAQAWNQRGWGTLAEGDFYMRPYDRIVHEYSRDHGLGLEGAPFPFPLASYPEGTLLLVRAD